MAQQHGLKIVTVADIIAYRLRTETFVKQVAEAAFPTEFGDFQIVVFENLLDKEHHIALVKGAIDSDMPVMVRVHSQSTMADVFYSLRSGGRNELRAALKMIQEAGKGVLVYLRQEEKGLNLVDEIRSYAIQDAGANPVETGIHQAPASICAFTASALKFSGLSECRKSACLPITPRRSSACTGMGLR